MATDAGVLQQGVNRHHRYMQVAVDPDVPYSEAVGDWLVNFGGNYLSGNGYKHCAGCGYVRTGEGEKLFKAGSTVPGLSTLKDYGFAITCGSCECCIDLYKLAKAKSREKSEPWEPIFRSSLREALHGSQAGLPDIAAGGRV